MVGETGKWAHIREVCSLTTRIIWEVVAPHLMSNESFQIGTNGALVTQKHLFVV